MDAWINPVTRAYEPSTTAVGELQRDVAPGIGNAVYLRLMTPLGSWWADPTIGSRLHELQRQKDLARVAALGVQYAQEALQPLLDDGRCTAIDVQAWRQPGVLWLLVTVTPAGREPVLFRIPVRVG